MARAEPPWIGRGVSETEGCQNDTKDLGPNPGREVLRGYPSVCPAQSREVAPSSVPLGVGQVELPLRGEGGSGVQENAGQSDRPEHTAPRWRLGCEAIHCMWEAQGS